MTYEIIHSGYTTMTDLLISILCITCILEVGELRSMLSKEQLEKAERYNHIYSALTMTWLSFFICRIIEVSTMKNVEFIMYRNAIVGAIVGVIIALLLIYFIGRYTGKKVDK